MRPDPQPEGETGPWKGHAYQGRGEEIRAHVPKGRDSTHGCQRLEGAATKYAPYPAKGEPQARGAQTLKVVKSKTRTCGLGRNGRRLF